MSCQHVYTGPPPAAIEDGDWRRVCRECGWHEHTFVLPYIPPGSNQLHRMHHMQVASWRAQLHTDVSRLVSRRLPLVEHARLTLDFRWKDHRQHDPGNGVEGMKGAIDELIGLWIAADDAEHLELLVRGKTGTGEADHVIVTLEDLDP